MEETIKYLKRLTKEILQALILVAPIKLAVVCFQHASSHVNNECFWCFIIAVIAVPLGVILLYEAAYIIELYIMPLWNWIWSEED